MTENIIQIPLYRFILVYLLLFVVLFIMKKSNIDKTKLLLLSSIRMTVQLFIAGFLLTYIFDSHSKLLVSLYIIVMGIFAVYRVFNKNNLSKHFKIVTALSMSVGSISVLVFYVGLIIRQNIFNPQYSIPIAGMLFGNTMTAVNLGVNSLKENLKLNQLKIQTLINLGVEPEKALLPIVNKSIEMAIIPNLNTMLGMGIVSLPGMMTGQILAGASPNTAIIYQIVVMICITATINIGVYGSLYFGFKGLINDRKQVDFNL